LHGKLRAGCAPVIDVSLRRGSAIPWPSPRSHARSQPSCGQLHARSSPRRSHHRGRSGGALTPGIGKGINASKERNRCARLGTGPRWGTPERRLEASHVPMPVVRQGPAPDGNRKCGIQPAHQSRSTDVQRSRLLPCTATSTFGSSHAGRAGRTNATSPLESGHQSGAASPRLWQLALTALCRSYVLWRRLCGGICGGLSPIPR